MQGSSVPARAAEGPCSLPNRVMDSNVARLITRDGQADLRAHARALRVWARPWRGPASPEGTVRRLHLPVFAELAWGDTDGEGPVQRYVLVADAGGLSPLALRPQLARLAHLGPMSELEQPTVVIATTSKRRVEAWQAVLEGIAARRQRCLLPVMVGTWGAWRARARSKRPARRSEATERPAPQHAQPPSDGGRPSAVAAGTASDRP